MNLADEIIAALRERGETISIAESITGGQLSAALTSSAGASHAFKGAVIAYSAASKIRDLAVDRRLIEDHSVYSKEVAAAMAIGVRARFDTDWSIATTGVAGPGSSHGIAPGKVWIHILGRDTQEDLAIELSGDREKVRSGAVTGALAAFKRILGR